MSTHGTLPSKLGHENRECNEAQQHIEIVETVKSTWLLEYMRALDACVGDNKLHIQPSGLHWRNNIDMVAKSNMLHEQLNHSNSRPQSSS